MRPPTDQDTPIRGIPPHIIKAIQEAQGSLQAGVVAEVGVDFKTSDADKYRSHLLQAARKKGLKLSLRTLTTGDLLIKVVPGNTEQ